MAAFGVLVEPHLVVTHGLHARGHLARLHRPDAVIARGGVEEDRRVALTLLHVLIRRECLYERPLLRLVGIAVLRHPRRARRQVRVALHVEERHLAHYRAEELGIHGEHVPHQQPAVASTLCAEVRRRGHASLDEVPGHGRKILVCARPVRLERRLVPARTVLATAADVRDHVHAAAREPRSPHGAAVAGEKRDLEAAVTVEEGGVVPVGGHPLRRYLEVRHARSVVRRGEVLAHLEVRRIEERRRLLHRFRFSFTDHSALERARREIACDVEPVLVAGIRIGFHHADRAEPRRAGHRLTLPLSARRSEHFETALHIVEHVEDQVVPGPAIRRERCVIVGLEEHCEVTRASHEAVEARREEYAGRIALPAHRPRRSRLDQQPLPMHAHLRIIRDLDPLPLVAREEIRLRVVEVLHHREKIALEAGRASVVRRNRHVGRLPLVDRLRRGERCAAHPPLRDTGVARFGHGARAEIGADVERVLVDPAHVALGHFELEAAFHEAPARDVELAHRNGIAAVGRERDEAALVLRLQALRTPIHPLLPLRLAEGVDVEDDVPLRARLRILLERGAAPDSARVLLVTPEVVEVLAHATRIRDASVGVEYFENAVAQRIEGRRLHEAFRGDRVLLLHPLHGAVGVDILEPEVGVGAGRVGLRGALGMRGGRDCGTQYQCEPELFHEEPLGCACCGEVVAARPSAAIERNAWRRRRHWRGRAPFQR